MNARQILQSALDKLGPNGERWMRGNFSNGRSFCAVGAMHEAVGADKFTRFYTQPEYMKARKLLVAQVSLATGGKCRSVVSFNDAYATGFADIRRVFQKAINRAAHRVIYRVS